jgi:hypothetical protein
LGVVMVVGGVVLVGMSLLGAMVPGMESM